MNKYIKHKIKSFAALYTDNLFDQYDVESFFVAARDYSGDRSFIREIGDFIAHPELKTQGVIQDNLVGKAIRSLDRFLDKYKRENIDITKIPLVELLCDNETIAKEIMQMFELSGLDLKIDVNDDSFRDFVFCTIVLLGNFNIKVDTTYNGKYKERIYSLEAYYSNHVTLELCFESSRFRRKAGSVSLLTVSNVWPGCITVLEPQRKHLDGFIARRFKDGYLAAIEFKNDRGQVLHCKNDLDGSTLLSSKTQSSL